MVKPIVAPPIQETQRPANTVSVLEDSYNEFSDKEIQEICSDRIVVHPMDTFRMMKNMNLTRTLCRGLAVTLRIVGGNAVLEDECDPDIPETTPISDNALSSLVYMAAAVCDMIEQDITNVANNCSWRKS